MANDVQEAFPGTPTYLTFPHLGSKHPPVLHAPAVGREPYQALLKLALASLDSQPLPPRLEARPLGDGVGVSHTELPHDESNALAQKECLAEVRVAEERGGVGRRVGVLQARVSRESGWKDTERTLMTDPLGVEA